MECLGEGMNSIFTGSILHRLRYPFWIGEAAGNIQRRLNTWRPVGDSDGDLGFGHVHRRSTKRVVRWSVWGSKVGWQDRGRELMQ